MTFPMTYKGGVSIQIGDDYVTIAIEEKVSGLFAIVAKIPAAEFLTALGRSSHRDCEFWLNESGKVGATREAKEELVPFDMHGSGKRPKDTDPDGYRTKATAKALAPFEVDGWRGEERDMWNWHNHVNGKGDVTYQRVRFIRFVRDGVPLP